MVVVVVDGELNSTGSRLLLTARPLTASTPGEQTQGYCMIGVTVFDRTENEEHWMCCCHVGSQVVDFRIQNSAFYEADRSAFLPCLRNGGCIFSMQQHIRPTYILYLLMSLQGRLAMFAWMGIPLRKLYVMVMVHVSSWACR